MSDDTASERVADERFADEETLLELVNPLKLSLRHQLGVLGLVALGLLPLGVEPITVLKLTGALYFAMFAMSWDAVSGYTGQISFGQGIFFAAGGYTSALLNTTYGLDPLVTIAAGVVVAAIAGVVIGVPALRLKGPYLSLVTLVAPLILLQVFIIESDTFGGELGLPSPDSVLGFDPTANYYLAYGLFVAILVVLLAVTRSDAGAVFTAIREDEDAVAAVGLNPAKFKTFAFVLSAAVGGLAGGFFVHSPVGNPSPSQLFTLTVNIEVIIAAILGGMGTIVGAALGGLFLVLFRDFLANQDVVIPLLGVPISDVDFLLFSLVALVLLFVFPGGLLRWGIGAGRRVLARLSGGAVATDGGRGPSPAEREPAERVEPSGRDSSGGERR